MVFLNPIRFSALRIRPSRLDLARAWEKPPSLLCSLCVFTLAASITLGGGTRAGFLSDTILELIAIPAFLVALASLVALPWNGDRRGADWALMLCAAIAIVPLIQLIPLPPWIWTRLPHRDQITNIFGLFEHDLP